MEAQFLLMTEEGKAYPANNAREVRHLRRKLEEFGHEVATYTLKTKIDGSVAV
jgi:hypothetical protein